jgi:hypothetical protein
VASFISKVLHTRSVKRDYMSVTLRVLRILVPALFYSTSAAKLWKLPLLSSVKVMNTWNFTSFPPLYLQDA